MTTFVFWTPSIFYMLSGCFNGTGTTTTVPIIGMVEKDCAKHMLFIEYSSVWYLPHHIVLQPAKSFECELNFWGDNPNNHCLQRPDLTNNSLMCCYVSGNFVLVLWLISKACTWQISQCPQISNSNSKYFIPHKYIKILGEHRTLKPCWVYLPP